MKRISLILFSLLLITVCAISFAEEAPWVTKKTCGNTAAMFGVKKSHAITEQRSGGFSHLPWIRRRPVSVCGTPMTGVRMKQHASCFNPGESKWSPAERLCFGNLSARQTFSIMDIQMFQLRMYHWCSSSVFPVGAGVKKEP